MEYAIGMIKLPVEVNILRPRDIVKLSLIHELREAEREVVRVVHMNSELYATHVCTAAIGSLMSTTMEGKDIFRDAVTQMFAGGVYVPLTKYLVMVHNHPAEKGAHPSRADLECAMNVQGAGRVLTIPVLDSIIIATEDHYSMMEHGRTFVRSEFYRGSLADFRTMKRRKTEKREVLWYPYVFR